MRKALGFTTVELMVTLFVAVLFILSGFQLYDMVNSRSSVVRETAEANGVAYEVLRKEGSEYRAITNSCDSPVTESVARSGLKISNLSIKLNRCKPYPDSQMIQVTAVVKFGDPQREVAHAAYVAN